MDRATYEKAIQSTNDLGPKYTRSQLRKLPPQGFPPALRGYPEQPPPCDVRSQRFVLQSSASWRP